MSEELFNEENPFIGPSPEDVAYYGLEKLKVKPVNTVTTESLEEDDEDDYDDEENEMEADD